MNDAIVQKESYLIFTGENNVFESNFVEHLTL